MVTTATLRSWLVTVITTGITSFAATNIDDIVMLTLFYTQADATFRKRHIVAGQYLGFTALIITSLPGFFGGLIVPRPWIGLLGLLPIAIGIKQLVSWQDDADAEVQAVTTDFNTVCATKSLFNHIRGITASIAQNTSRAFFNPGRSSRPPLILSSNNCLWSTPA